MTYKIIRVFMNDEMSHQTIKTGLTLKEAREHCRDPNTSSRTCTTATGQDLTDKVGAWFDGYEEE